MFLLLLQQAWIGKEKSVENAQASVVNRIGGLGKIEKFQEDQEVVVHTGKTAIHISLQGGAVTSALLTDFTRTLNSQEPFKMLSEDPEHLYILQVGVSGDADLTYTCPQKSYEMGPGNDQMVVVLHAKDEAGMVFEKRFIFFQDQYHFNVKTTVYNTTNSPWAGMHYARILLRHDSPQPTLAKNIFVHPDDQTQGWLTLNTYTGPAYFSDSKSYVKVPFTEVEKKPLSRQIEKPGWIAMQQRYFISALIPQQTGKHVLTATWQSGTANTTDTLARNLFKFSSVGAQISLDPGEKSSEVTTIYTGPEDAKRLAALAKGLELTVDYGWLWFISDILFQGLVWVHSGLGNWGLSIIVITFLVKLAFYRLSATGYATMAKQKKIQGKIDTINKKFKDNPEQKNKENWALYRKESINPFLVILPTLLQIPFFIALYYVLIESVQLRFQPFLWIPDLSSKDPFFILPALFFLSMLGMQSMSPVTHESESQVNAQLAVPFVVGIMCAQMPAGLLLYWITNNALTMLQQWVFMQNQ